MLLHGFTGNPNAFTELAESLAKKDIAVSIPMLPGHGTYSADLFNYGWRDWFNCAKSAYFELKSACEEIFICGLSMGGTLALHLAAHYPCNGVVSLAAAMELPAWKKLMTRSLRRLVKYQNKRNGEDVKDEKAKQTLGSYQRFPLHAAEQLFQLLDHVRDDLPEISVPILVIHSVHDHTIPFSNAALIFDSVASSDKRKVDLDESYHVITVDCEKDRVKKEVFDFFQKQSRLLQPIRKPGKRAAKTRSKAKA